MSDTTIPDRTRALAEQAALMRSQPVSHGWNELWNAMEQLDHEAAPGLTVGRYLLLPSGDGHEPYVVDQIDQHQVHVVYLGIDDGPTAPAVDPAGWCLRSIAEAEITRRDAEGTGEQNP